VTRVDEIRRAEGRFLASLQRRVVTQIGGDVDVDPAASGRAEAVVAGTAEDGDTAYLGVGVSRTRTPTLVGGRAAASLFSEGTQRRGLRARRPTRPTPWPCFDVERLGVHQPAGGERVAHARVRDVGVGVVQRIARSATTARVTARPFAVVVATECMPRSSSGWWAIRSALSAMASR
jgi:hypothetical protein